MPNAVDLVPLINGKAYEWADVNVMIMGVPIAGITAIKYNDDQDMENNYGAGNKPVSRGYGNITFDDCALTLMSEEVEALQKLSPTGRIQDIPEFNIIVAYIPTGGLPVKHTLKMVRFKSNKRDTKQGDKKIEVELPIIVGDIKWK